MNPSRAFVYAGRNGLAVLRMPTLPALALLSAVALLSGGCLSHEHRIHTDSLHALAHTPPEARGQSVRVVQKIGQRRGPAVAPAVPPPPPAPPPQDVYYGGPNVYVNLQLDARVGGGPSPARPASGPPSGGFSDRPPTSGGALSGGAHPSGGFGGGNSGGGASGGGDSLPDDLRVLAVVVIAVAAFAAVGLIATEGVRYDGYAALSPAQPLRLRSHLGERVVTVAELQPQDLVGLDEALVSDDEGYGLWLRGRAPLDRRGFTFKLDFGSHEVALRKYLTSGFASNLQLGYFITQHLGLLGTMSLGFGKSDLDNLSFFRNYLGAEVQAFLPGLSILHLGGFFNGGSQLVSSGDGFQESRPAFGTGLLLELELTTRLALGLRAGWTWAQASGGWDAGGFGLSAGISIY